MDINKNLIMNIFKTISQFDNSLLLRIGANETIKKEKLLNEIIEIIANTSPTKLNKLSTENDVKDFIISELKKIDKNINNTVLIDRYTSQTLLKPFLVKGLFKGYTELQTRDEILETEKKERNIDKFQIEDIREILFEAGEYKYNGYYIRDFKEFVIGFSARIYIDYLKEKEDSLKEEVKLLKIESEEKLITETLRKLHLYKLAHKLAIAILGEISIQRKFKNLKISKEYLITTLGYNVSEKQIYQDIKESIFSLRWLEFVIWDYAKINKKAKKRNYANSITVGSFLNTLTEKEHHYIFDINEKFVGCLQYIIEKDAKENKDKLNYFHYPLSNLSATKNYSNSAYFLTDFLLRESGNIKLNTQKYKIISYKIEKYITEANITNKHNTQKYRTFLNALSEIDIIEKIEPSINNLKKIKPKKAFQTNLKIYIERDVKILAQKIQTQEELGF